MFELLERVPSYSKSLATHITRDAYSEAVTELQKHLARAFKMFEAYWKSGNTLLFDMSLEELKKAARFMDSIIYAVGDEKTIEKLSKRGTFMYNLAAAMMGSVTSGD